MIFRTTLFAAVAAFACGFGTTGALADDTKTLTDEEFVRKASACDQAEVRLGKLAAERASNAKVREFGQQMAEEHGKCLRELTQIAEQKKMTVARRLDNKHQTLSDKMARLSGDEFDREYVKHMVKGHKEAVALFEAESRSGKDMELRAFAAKALPTIQKHLETAQNIAKQLNVDVTGSKD